jgi:hypothetical protein
MFIPDPDLDFLQLSFLYHVLDFFYIPLIPYLSLCRIPDPGAKKAPDLGSRILIPDPNPWQRVRTDVFRFHSLQWSAHEGEDVGRTVTITLLTREEGFGDSSLVFTLYMKSFYVFRLLKGAPPGRRQVNYYTGELAQLAISQVVRVKLRVITGQKKGMESNI